MNKRHIQETRIFKSQLGHRFTAGNENNNETNDPVMGVREKSVEQIPQDITNKNDVAIEPESPKVVAKTDEADTKSSQRLKTDESVEDEKNDIGK